MNILVTGGAGFIGSALVGRLSEHYNNNLYVIDDLSTGKLVNIPKRKNIVFFRADVNKKGVIETLLKKTDLDYIFHYSAFVGVDRTTNTPEKSFDDFYGLRNIIELAKLKKIKRLFFSSSSEIYGEQSVFPYKEDFYIPNMELPYPAIKVLGETMIKTYSTRYNFEFTIFRFFNTYGPNQGEEYVMNKFISAAVNNGILDIYGNGLQTRSFCYIDDNIDATVRCLNTPLYINDIVNIGNNEEISIKDLAELIIKISSSQSLIKYHPARIVHESKRRVPDVTKMKELLSREFTSLEDGIRIILRNYRESNL